MRRILVIGAVAASMFAWNVSTSWAGVQGTFTIDPTSGPAGTTIHVVSQGGACPIDADVHIGLFTLDNLDNPIAEVDTTALDEDPEWSADLVVPSDAKPGKYEVDVICEYPPREFSFQYDSQFFTVTAPPATTTTSTTTTTVKAAAATTTTTTTVAVAPAATPAQPVVASPALTG